MRVRISGSPVSAWRSWFELAEVVEHLPPRAGRAAGGIGEVEHRLLAAAELHALIARRQEAAAPQAVVERLVGPASREHDDERRQVLVHAAQAIATQAPMLGRPASCEPVWMNVMAGSWLIASVCIDRMMQRSSAIAGRVRQQFADPGAALAVLGELEDRRRHRASSSGRRSSS